MECQYTHEAAGASYAVAPQMQAARQLTPEEIRTNKYCDSSIYTRKGIFLMFINTNSIGATSLIGGKRLNLADISRLPAYLAKHEETIKVHAMHLLLSHFQSTQCSTGVGETLTTQDISLSFSIASVSEFGAALNPNGRHEGPVFFSAVPDWLQEMPTYTNEEGIKETAHVVNAYVYLHDAARRRHVVAKRLAEQQSGLPAITHEQGPSKKQKMSGQPGNRRPYIDTRLMIQQQDNTLGEIKSVQESVSTLANEVRQLRLPAYPRLPEKQISWPPVDSLPDLPDDIWTEVRSRRRRRYPRDDAAAAGKRK